MKSIMVNKSQINNQQWRRELTFISYICYTIFLFQRYLATFGIPIVYISLLLLIILPLCIGFQKIDKFIFILLSFAFGYFINNGLLNLFVLYSFVYLFRHESLRRIALFNLTVDCIVLFSIPFLLEFGLLKDDVELEHKGIVHTFGFSNPNTLGLTGFYLMISLYVYLRKLNSFFLILLLIIINQFFYSFALSRTAYFAGLTLILFVILRSNRRFVKNFRPILISLPIIFTIIVFYFLFNWQDYGELNWLLSLRLTYLGESLEQIHGINWVFGKEFQTAIDCAFFGLIVSGGIIWLLFFLFTTEYAFINKYPEIRIDIPILVAMLVSGLGENTFCSPNGASVLFWSIIINKGNPYIYQKLNLYFRYWGS